MEHFTYQRAGSITEALELKEQHGEQARFLSGGTDILLLIKKGIISPRLLISLRNIKELRGIRQSGNKLVIGSGTTLRTLEKSKLIADSFPALHDAVSQTASVQIRNVATLGGNIINASPGADCAAPLLIYRAIVTLVNRQGQERGVSLESFFTGFKRIDLKPDEIVKEFIIEMPPTGAGSAYLKFMKRNAMDLAHVGVGIYLSIGKNDHCEQILIGLATVAPTPIRAESAEKYLQGRVIDQDSLTAAAEIAVGSISPIDDFRGRAWHKTEIVKTYIRRAGMLALSRVEKIINSTF
ncbi:MAG: xanthine dehydrogenase family protein subunit M [Pseudomonadota bacterium]|nr:xanthine dehydrogenase family protein subunit M [Pseudomonadota bacterium]